MKEWMGHVGAMLVVAVWGTTFVSSKVLILALELTLSSTDILNARDNRLLANLLLLSKLDRSRDEYIDIEAQTYNCQSKHQLK